MICGGNFNMQPELDRDGVWVRTGSRISPLPAPCREVVGLLTQRRI
jgi:hypothetical protein